MKNRANPKKKICASLSRMLENGLEKIIKSS